MDTVDIARKMRGPGGDGRVFVLDVSFSSTKYHVFLRDRASRHAYYLRPPEGMDANDLKKILDEAGGEEVLEFRYFTYPELHTDLKPILTADPYAERYFQRSEDRRFLQIEGERPNARETIASLLEQFKEPFSADEFPRIHEFALKSYKSAEDGHSELFLLRKDQDRNELRRAEPGFHVAIAEHGFAKEIDVHRPTVGEAEPVLIFSSNESTTSSGFKFLAVMASYFESPTYAVQSVVAAKTHSAMATQVASKDPPSYASHGIKAPRIEHAKLDERQLLAATAAAMRDQIRNMKLLQKREVTGSGPSLVIRFPGVMGFGKGPSAKEISELEAVYRATKGDPSFGAEWYGYYQTDSKTGDLRVVTNADPKPPIGWTALNQKGAS